MTRYAPSRHYLHAGLAALACASFSAWCGLTWAVAFVPAALFVASAAALGWLALRPAIEIHETHLAVGSRLTPWPDIRRLDSTGWLSPLVLRLTLFDDQRLWLVYPGDPGPAGQLLRQLRQMARHALIDGIPHRRFWGEALPPGAEHRPLPSPRYRLLRPEDETDVERLYQRLKTVGHLDAKSSPDDE